MTFDIDTIVIDIDVLVPQIATAEVECVVPIVVFKDKGLIYRGIVSDLIGGSVMMINGKAPFGSSEDDAVWTVYINPLDEFGNVIEEEIEVLENRIWSEIEQMYN